MFLAIFNSNNKQPIKIPGLKNHEWGLGTHSRCSICVDPGTVDIRQSSDSLVISDRELGCETIATIPLDGSGFRFYKPLTYGMPIYYLELEGVLAVSSHIRLLREAGFSLELDPSLLPEYFVFRYVCPPRTLLRGVNCIPLDCELTGSTSPDRSGPATIHWTRRFTDAKAVSGFDEGVEDTVDALTSSIQTLSPHAQSVACLLSGGVDSSILFDLAKTQLGLHESHSTGYPFARDSENGEKLYANSAAKLLDARHTYHELSDRSFLHSIVDAIAQSEVPLIHLQSALLCELFSGRLPQSDRIVLNGQGADGLYGLNIMFNYNHYKYMMHKPLAPALQLASLFFTESFFPFKKFSTWARRSWSTDFDDESNGLWMLGIFGDIEWVSTYFGASAQDIFRNRRLAIEKLQAENILDAFSALDLIGDVALTQDLWGQISREHGKRQYYAFNDPQVVSAARSVSWDDKLMEPKHLLREAGRRMGVPDTILDRPKLGFGIPSRRWSRPGGLMEPMLKLIDSKVDLELVKEFQSDREASAMVYWNWVNLGIWQRLVIDGENVEHLHAELDEAITQLGT